MLDPIWKDLPNELDDLAPDGSEVRVLLSIPERGGMAHFRLQPGQVSKLVTHRTVDEIWYILGGTGEMWVQQWRKEGQSIELKAGRCIRVPVGIHFQFRAAAESQLDILGVTMPGWPLDREEAVRTEDHWLPNVPTP